MRIKSLTMCKSYASSCPWYFYACVEVNEHASIDVQIKDEDAQEIVEHLQAILQKKIEKALGTVAEARLESIVPLLTQSHEESV